MDPGDAVGHQPFSHQTAVFDLVPLRLPLLVAEALGTRAIPGELSAILVGRFQAVREEGAALPSDKRSGQGIHSFLVQLMLGVDHIPGLERVILVEVDPDVMVHLFYSLFFVSVDLYSTRQRLFACLGELTTDGIPPMVDILHDAFATRSSIYVVT